jgi:hypothetical protein
VTPTAKKESWLIDITCEPGGLPQNPLCNPLKTGACGSLDFDALWTSRL